MLRLGKEWFAAHGLRALPWDGEAGEEILKGSGVLIGGNLQLRSAEGEQIAETRMNWSGNYLYSTDLLHEPANEDEVRRLVAGSGRLKALGSRHSFNGIADTTGAQVSLGRLRSIVLDCEAGTVTVGAGVRYGELAPYLDQRGFALHNLASLPHLTVVGACATATHGSGVGNGALSTAVTGLEMVTAKGEVVALSRERDGEEFRGAVVGLGALGLVTKMTLAVQPRFEMRQVVYENLSFDVLERHLEEIFASGYSVSLFTDWQGHRATQVWIKSRCDGEVSALGPEFFGATAATTKMHPLPGHPAENCTEQMGVPGPWCERMPHFRMDHTPSSGAELQTEYFVPRERGYEAILALEELRDEMAPHLFVSELRAIAADDLWMSMAYGRDSMAIHSTWKPDVEAVKALLPRIEKRLEPFAARPHWAKLFTTDRARLRSLYPKMSKFEALARKYDPPGQFRNAFLDRTVFAG